MLLQVQSSDEADPNGQDPQDSKSPPPPGTDTDGRARSSHTACRQKASRDRRRRSGMWIFIGEHVTSGLTTGESRR